MTKVKTYCSLANHWYCNHDLRDIPIRDLAAEISSHIDTDAYLAGWATIATADEDEATMLWMLLEHEGANDDYGRGVRDGLEAAFGTESMGNVDDIHDTPRASA